MALGRSLIIVEVSSGAIRHTYPDHKSTVFDLVWNPVKPDEIVTVCNGGAKLWRLGEEEPFDQFDWGGASLVVTWSPDGRWVVTGDQTPSVHLYDVKTRIPLHIQGFETKVKSFAWQRSGTWLASAGGSMITVWPCSGKEGPSGATPIQLFGHQGDVSALQFPSDGSMLISGGRDGFVMLWNPHDSEDPVTLVELPGEVSALAASPLAMASGTADGLVSIHEANPKKS